MGKPPRWRLNRPYHIMHAAQLGARIAPPRYPETTSATHPPWTLSKLEIFQQTTSITKVKVRVVQLLLQLPARLFGITKLCLQVVDLSFEASNSLLDSSHRLQPNAPYNFSDLGPKADHFVVHNTNDSTRVMDAFDQSHRIMLILPNGKDEPTTIKEGRLPRKEQQRQEPYPDQLLGHSIDQHLKRGSVDSSPELSSALAPSDQIRLEFFSVDQWPCKGVYRSLSGISIIRRAWKPSSLSPTRL
ncbi:hypothetical protein B296_00021691 [Ensete ventricosum]|uniref:Uncharacterized protein n=1 Tax=Ensete ventricosum TaxID=4639 RepID=A0A426YZA5_ENSVE|nr:hypothetical protein B296_00021691 [Ensete ventricosum]